MRLEFCCHKGSERGVVFYDAVCRLEPSHLAEVARYLSTSQARFYVNLLMQNATHLTYIGMGHALVNPPSNVVLQAGPAKLALCSRDMLKLGPNTLNRCHAPLYLSIKLLYNDNETSKSRTVQLWVKFGQKDAEGWLALRGSVVVQRACNLLETCALVYKVRLR